MKSLLTTIFLMVMLTYQCVGQVIPDNLRTYNLYADTLEGVTVLTQDFNVYGYKEGLRKNFKLIGRDQGLSVSHGISMLEDHLGNIWIGGMDGQLVKFNGVDFQQYIIPGMSTTVMSIVQDNDNNLWFSMQSEGLFRYDGNQFYHYDLENLSYKSRTNEIRKMFIDSQDNLWLGSFGGTLILKDEQFKLLDYEDGVAEKIAISFAEDAQGRIWMGHYSEGISILDSAEIHLLKAESGLAHNRVYSLQCDLDNNMWAGTWKGLSTFENSNHENPPINKLDDISIWDIDNDPKGNIWACSNNRYGLYHISNGNIQNYTVESGLSSDRLMCLMVDSKGNVWQGTYGEGICKHDPDIFENFNKKSGLLDNKPWSVECAPNGEILIGQHGGISIYTKDSIEVFDAIPELSKFDVHDIFTDSKDNVWFSAQTDGIYKLEGSGDVVHYPHEIDDTRKWIFDINETLDGQVLFAGYGGLYSLKDDSLSSFSVGDEFIENGVWSIEIDLENNIWLGLQSNGFILIPNDSLVENLGVEYFHFSSQLIENTNENPLEVYDILCEENGRIWFATATHGLIHGNKEHLYEYIRTNSTEEQEESSPPLGFEVFDVKSGFYSNNVLSIFKDSRNIIWVGTDNGLTSIQESEGKFKLRGYRKSAGIINTQISFNNIAEDNEGNIWWCSESYLMKYVRDNDIIDTLSPIVSLNKVKLLELDIDWRYPDEQIVKREKESYFASLFSNYIHYNETFNWSHNPVSPVFSHDQNHLTFHFSASNWIREDELIYKTKLDGLDEEWSLETKANILDHSSLPSGEYTLLIKARNADGVWSDTFEYAFVIMPPFWKTKWFIVLMVIIAIILTFALFKYRIKQLEKENIILESKVKVRTKELRIEKKKSDDLLLNILPKETADELKNHGEAETKVYPSASVLFSDFKGFTQLTETMNSKELVSILDNFFRQFDEASQKYGIEKIKTIGDSYMCASGIPAENDTHALRLVSFGLEMLKITENINQERRDKGLDAWDIRIGIHTGPLIAGVVGKKKFAYDIWGDTVNVASRMESSGEAGRLNISSNTHERINGYFNCESRGMVKAKNKGELEMFFVNNYLEEFASEHSNLSFNDTFGRLIKAET